MKHFANPLTIFSLIGPVSAATTLQAVTLDTDQPLGAIASGASGGIDYENYEFVFDRFDSSLGTLNQVSFSATISHTSSATNNQNAMTFIVTSYGVSYTANDVVIGGSGTGSGNGTPTLGEFFTTTDVSSATDQLFDPAHYSEFTGVGTMVFGIDRFSNDSTNNAEIIGDFLNFSVQRDAGAFVTLVYDYTPVPEPSGAALIGLMGLSMAVVRRRLPR